MSATNHNPNPDDGQSEQFNQGSLPLIAETSAAQPGRKSAAIKTVTVASWVLRLSFSRPPISCAAIWSLPTTSMLRWGLFS